MPHPLDGIHKKLERANENIRNLEREIAVHLAPVPLVHFEGVHATVTQQDREAWEKLRDYTHQKVPLRFSILAGEIIHHLRSSLDHLAWQLSDPTTRDAARRWIEFPILDIDPGNCGMNKTKRSQFCRKVQSITSPTALARIDSLQPHRRSDPLDDPLWLIHDMDITDKHRELVLVAATARAYIVATGTLNIVMENKANVPPWGVPVIIGMSKVDVGCDMSPQVAFEQFGKRENESIIPALTQLLRFTSNLIESFAGEFQ
jgi:hypothetical protein